MEQMLVHCKIHSMPGFIIISRDIIVMQNKNSNVAKVPPRGSRPQGDTIVQLGLVRTDAK